MTTIGICHRGHNMWIFYVYVCTSIHQNICLISVYKAACRCVYERLCRVRCQIAAYTRYEVAAANPVYISHTQRFLTTFTSSPRIGLRRGISESGLENALYVRMHDCSPRIHIYTMKTTGEFCLRWTQNYTHLFHLWVQWKIPENSMVLFGDDLSVCFMYT